MKKTLHVGLVLLNLPLDKTCGSCRHVGDLASALIKKGIRVTIFASWSQDRKHVSDLKRKGIYIREINFPSLKSWGNFVNQKNSLFVNKGVFACIQSIISENKKHPIDVLNIQHLIGSPVVGAAIKHFLDIPFVLTCQGSDIYELSDKKYKNMFSLASVSDALICISPKVKKSILLMNDQIKTVKKLLIIPLGVDKDVFRCFNRPRKNQVLFAGRLIREKGVDEAIKVFLSATNSKELSHYKLVIAGCGDLETSLKKKYASFIKEKRIIFLGPASQKKIVSIFNDSKVFLFTSTWEEPFGMVLTESLATGTPVLANNVGFVKEIISKEAGIVIPKNNWTKFAIELKKLLSDDKRWDYLSRGAKIASNRYDWDETVKAIIKVYESVIN